MTNPRVLYRDAALADGRSDRLHSDPAALWRVWRVSWSPDPVAV